MKRFVLVGLIIAGVLGMTAGVGVHAATVRGTRHDLSVTGPGPIRSGPSGGTSEVCVFCHTPHGAANVAGAPLWNKNLNTPTYELYTSDVLSQLGYTGADIDQPVPSVKAVHLKSRLCLSCHDGTIALGNLANLPTVGGFTFNIPVSDTSGYITNMPTSAEGYIGLDLRDDHPIAIVYSNTKDPELNPAVPVPPAPGVKVFPGGGNNYVECTSCHEPHDDTYPPFLVATNAGSALCTTCHSSKTGYTGSIHETSGVGYQPPDGAGGLPDIGTTVGGVKCMNCHYPHKAGVSSTGSLPDAPPADLTTYPKLGQYLLALQEQMSCYNEKNRWGQGATNVCHAGAGGKNIKAEVEGITGIRHRVKDYTGAHQATEHRNADGSAKYDWLNNGGTWHVECDDCHNSHTAMNTNHVASRGTNAVGANSPLKGAGGVSVSTWPTWAGLSGSYTYIEPVGLITTAASTLNYEYEICFKCHSDFAWGANLPPSGSTNPAQQLTNQALEFGVNSVAYHPVANTTTAAGHQPPAPQGTYTGPWAANPGNQTMYCSDCHTKEGDGNPTGPHGSANNYILRTPYDDFLMPVGSDQPPTDLCFDCHSQAVYLNGLPNTPGTGFYDGGANINLHVQHQIDSGNVPPSTYGYRCVNCHATIPHGYSRKGMIVTIGDVPPAGAAYAPAGGPLINTAPLALSGTYLSGIGNKNLSCTTLPGCH